MKLAAVLRTASSNDKFEVVPGSDAPSDMRSIEVMIACSSPEPTPSLLALNKAVQSTLSLFSTGPKNASPLAERGLVVSARAPQRCSEAP